MGRLSLVVAALAALSGCNTPQIPLPPPVIEDISFALVDAEAKLGRVSGSGKGTPQMANSTVRVINLRDGYGVIAPASADGSFETRLILVLERDDLQIDYSFESEQSDSLCVTVSHDGPLSRCAAR